MANILIVSLGESPIVVTAMYDLLTTEEKQRELGKIDKVVVLYPWEEMVQEGYVLIKTELEGVCELEPLMLPFEDANNEQTSFTFLQALFQLLSTHQKVGDHVYLSPAGGRKSMSSLMALVVPLFTCVKKLYHVLDKYEDDFRSIEQLILELSEEERRAAMHPELDRLDLVPIPFGEYHFVSDEFRSRMFTITEEELDDLWDEEPDQADALEFAQNIANSGKALEVVMTERAATRYRKVFAHDAKHKRWLEKCVRKMRFSNKLRHGVHGNFSIKSSPNVFHFYKSMRTQVRPFFHTEPKDINACPDRNVERVIISELEIEKGDVYKQGEEILRSLKFPLSPTIPVENILPQKAQESLESILIVPLGEMPMMATQLYTLLKSEGRNIREVVLVYPELSRDIRAGAKIIMDAFEHENTSVTCWEAPVPNLKDVNSEHACLEYQQSLEKTIKKIRDKHSDWQIELALSGGRKGMAALAMFVAQKMGLRYVYHTLIKDKEVSRKVDHGDTSVSSLEKLKGNKELRNNRLFLREYEVKGEGPYTKFVLFKVPVLPAGK